MTALSGRIFPLGESYKIPNFQPKVTCHRKLNFYLGAPHIAQSILYFPMQRGITRIAFVSVSVCLILYNKSKLEYRRVLDFSAQNMAAIDVVI